MTSPKIIEAAELFEEWVYKLCSNRKHRERLHDIKQKQAHDEVELYFVASEIGCDREELK